MQHCCCLMPQVQAAGGPRRWQAAGSGVSCLQLGVQGGRTVCRRRSQLLAQDIAQVELLLCKACLALRLAALHEPGQVLHARHAPLDAQKSLGGLHPLSALAAATSC